MRNTVVKVPGTATLIHNNRGFQYTSRGFRETIKHKLKQNISRVGKCIDNSFIE